MEIGRQKLPHETPLGMPLEEEVFFVTVCSLNRGSSELLEKRRAEIILEAVTHRQQSGVWFARVFVVMPDHVHALIHFLNPAHPMRKAILDFKRWTARAGGFRWQDDFFDHRLRHEESMGEKADYILMNPVRAGLVGEPEAWPHRFVAGDALG